MLSKLKKRIEKLRRLLWKHIKKPINNSHHIASYNQLLNSQFVLFIENNALVIKAKDQSGTVNLIGSVPLSSINTIPRLLGTSSNITVQVTSPYKVIYIDQISLWWPPSAIAQNFYDMIDAGFNIINIAFFVNGSAADIALAWANDLAAIDTNGKSYRQNILDYAHSRNAAILISAGGATEGAYCSIQPSDYVGPICEYARHYQLDGVDYDLEGIAPLFIGPGASTTEQTITWLVDVTNLTRDTLGPNALISHAPQAPYLGKPGSERSWVGPTGGYIEVLKRTDNINFLNVQYYNQGNQYNNYVNIYLDTNTYPYNSFPDSAVSDFPSIYWNKLVLGKPFLQRDADTGYNTPQEINSIILQAKQELQWNAGVMTWQFPYDSSSPLSSLTTWLSTVMNNF